DRSSVDLPAEAKAIDELLHRTYDTRLIVLDMRFQALKGEIQGFADGAKALETLAKTYWQDFHPKPESGDYTFRINALEGVVDPVCVILPLQFAPLVRGARGGSVSLRNYLVATGKVEARGSEETVALDAISRMLGDGNLAEQVTATFMTVKAAS